MVPPVTRASVIVPARDAEDTLGRTLRALARQQLDGGYEVIVVDDGSTDRTAEVARAAPGPVTVLQQAAEGPGQARNRGVAASGGQVLAFCDADVFPTPGWLAAGLAAVEHAELVQGRVLPDPDTALGPYDRSIWVTFDAGLWETANLFSTRELFDRVGGFEEWIRPDHGKALFEDVWFGWRAVRAGATHAFAPDALAHHAVFPRGPGGYVAERERLVYFPAAAARMPELRDCFFFARFFLNRRAAAFDLALAGALAALVRRSPLPLLVAAPYLAALRRVRGAAVVDLAADALGFASLVRGSVRYRSPLL